MKPAATLTRYALVFVGGGLGTGLRYLLEHALPAPSAWPLPTLIINLAGAFVLGLLLEALLQRGPDTGWRQRVRLFGGPGFLGGFTTYSTLSFETEGLLGASRFGAALAYGGLSLVGGVLAALVGIALARMLVPAGPLPARAADQAELDEGGEP